MSAAHIADSWPEQTPKPRLRPRPRPVPTAAPAPCGSPAAWCACNAAGRDAADAAAAVTVRQSAGPPVRPTDPIVIGTATDPYQPGERRFRVTRRVLERLARCEGLNIGIITKSPLVTRDIDVLRRIAERSDLQVHVSLTTVDVEIIIRLEARSPMPAARLRALHKLTSAGVNAGLIVAPVLPGITDDVPHLEALFQAAREAGARFIHAGPLRLYPAVRDRFLPVLDAHFPHLSERYRRAYERASEAPRPYAAALGQRVRRLQRRFGFPEHEGMRA